MAGDGVAGIKRRGRDLSSDGVWNLATTSGRGRLKEDLESSTMYKRNEAITSSSSLLSGGTIFTHEEPGALYRHYQLKANQAPIRMDKSNAWRAVAQDIEVSATKEAVRAMQSLQAIIHCKAQICFGKSTKDKHWSDQGEYVKQNKEATRILVELEALAQRLGHNNI
ncbi:hypothetical protein Tco_0496756 [Tanacetum coccineum]